MKLCNCGKEISKPSHRCTSCSNRQRKGKYKVSEKGKENMRIAKQGYGKGDKNPNWKQGTRKKEGYILVYAPNHPNAIRGAVKRSRLVMEEYLGRFLTSKEVVHHKNCIKEDDRIENLELMENQSKHATLHAQLNREKIEN